MEDTQVGGENNGDVEVAPALISVQPSQDSVAVAVGSDLRVLDFRGGCGVTLVDETGEAFHKDSIIGSCLYQLVMINLSIFGLLVLGSALLPCKLFYSLKFMFSRP
ncbi:hypothetical protein Peur_046976 [Populus x canadensis]